jgi:hypothetical protein
MNVAEIRDSGEFTKVAFALANSTAVAAGSGDNTEVNGAALDLLSFTTRFRSAKLAVAIAATLASGETITVAGQWQDSANGSSWSDYGSVVVASVAGTGPSGGGAVSGVVEMKVNLSGARRYVRCKATPNLSRAGTDTATMSGVYVLGGPDALPIFGS